MKVKEGNRTPKGEYIGVYGGLIKTGNVIGLKKGKDDKRRLMFRIKSDPDPETGKRVQIPLSFVWDFDDQRTIAALGCLGVDAARLKLISEKSGEEKAITWFDQQAEEKGFRMTVYVMEDGGFGGTPRPVEGNFKWRFLRWSSRDRETGKPIYEWVGPKKGTDRDGKTYTRPGYNKLWAEFVVADGPRKGAVQRRMLHYAIVEGEDGEWELDGEQGMGAEFLNLLTSHDIPIKSIEPDKHFKNPKNGLPELEKMLLKKAPKTTLSGEVKKGWLGRLSLAKAGEQVEDDTPVDVGGDDGADAELVAKVSAMLDKRVRKAMGKSAWGQDGKLSSSGSEWVNENLGELVKKGIKVSKLADDGQAKLVMRTLKEKFPL